MKKKTITLYDEDEIRLKELTKWYQETTCTKISEATVIKYLIYQEHKNIKQFDCK